MISPHLLIDFYGCPREKLVDVSLVYDALDKLPEKLGLSKPESPNVFRYKGRGEEEWGVSGIALVDQSHISIHTFPDKGQAFVDIFSNKEINGELAAEELGKIFQASGRELSREGSPQEKIPLPPEVEGSVVRQRIYH